MKINYDVWAVAKSAAQYYQKVEGHEADIDTCTTQFYLTGIRVQNVMDYISEYHTDQLDRITAYVCGIPGKQVPNYLYYGFAYGLQVGLQVARQRIDKEMKCLADHNEKSYMEGYKAARAAIGKYKCERVPFHKSRS